MKEIWNAILKFLLSKTTLDEEIAEKVEKINEKVKSVDEIDNKKTKIKKQK